MAYAPQKPMTARPNPRGLALDAAGEREWDHSFFDMDVETCCFACWCPCMAYSQAHSKIQHLEANGTPHPTGGEFCGSSSWTFCVAQHLGVGWILATMQRTDVRKRYGLRGDGCMDCLGSAFCFAFAQTQQLREISDEEDMLRFGQGSPASSIEKQPPPHPARQPQPFALQPPPPPRNPEWGPPPPPSPVPQPMAMAPPPPDVSPQQFPSSLPSPPVATSPPPPPPPAPTPATTDPTPKYVAASNHRSSAAAKAQHHPKPPNPKHGGRSSRSKSAEQTVDRTGSERKVKQVAASNQRSHRHRDRDRESKQATGTGTSTPQPVPQIRIDPPSNKSRRVDFAPPAEPEPQRPPAGPSTAAATGGDEPRFPSLAHTYPGYVAPEQPATPARNPSPPRPPPQAYSPPSPPAQTYAPPQAPQSYAPPPAAQPYSPTPAQAYSPPPHQPYSPPPQQPYSPPPQAYAPPPAVPPRPASGGGDPNFAPIGSMPVPDVTRGWHEYAYSSSDPAYAPPPPDDAYASAPAYSSHYLPSPELRHDEETDPGYAMAGAFPQHSWGGGY